MIIKGVLQGVSPEIRQKRIAGRVRELESQIKRHQQELIKIEKSLKKSLKKMKIKIDQLDAIFKEVVLKLKFYEIDSIELDEDYYLLISSADWVKIAEPDPEPVTGSLVDDWNMLEKVVTGDNPMTFVDFDRLASILRAISQKLNPEA